VTEFELLIDFHLEGARQGPGSENETLKALDLIEVDTSSKLQIADIGCGTGSQTLALAKNINANIKAVDLFPRFLKQLDQKIIKTKLQGTVQTFEASMDNLPFEYNEFDIMWSEGAIYIMGFEKGINYWNKFLKPGGHLAVSEVTWLTQKRPNAIEKFWQQQYPEIDLAGNKIKLLEKSGYSLTGYFTIDQNSWMDNYYLPMNDRFSSFLQKHDNSKLAQKVVDEHQSEVELYLKYKEYYSYGFYIVRKEGKFR